MPEPFSSIHVIGSPISVGDWSRVISLVFHWSSLRQSRTVCVCNAHSLVTALSDPDFSDALHSADLTIPDGHPVAFMMRRLGQPDQHRLSGPDLMLRVCELSAVTGTSIFLYGGTAATLDRLRDNLLKAYPGLLVAGMFAPPFRELSPAEDAAVVRQINDSGARIVWVGLGCPRQERWMVAHRGRIKAVMLGVGVAFDYHAGTIRRAPFWMQRRGLEWLHRLLSDPKRLWRRYLVTNTIFIFCAVRQLLVRFARQLSSG